MLFDDRLATVLRLGAASEPAARTQFRQLLDLLGTALHDIDQAALEPAYARLSELSEILPAAVQSSILREPGSRLRNRALLAWLADGAPQAAAAAMATAQLSESDWLHLIPRLPIAARGFLRHRRDLPESARQVLERLGVRDLVLPEPVAELQPPAPTAMIEEEASEPADAGIAALVRRIEAFQRSRRQGEAPVSLSQPATGAGIASFDFATDGSGTITWAEQPMAPMAVGMTLGGERPGAIAVLEDHAAEQMARRLPLRAARIEIDGVPAIAGEWRIDAVPLFASDTGRFTGYHGRLRRAVVMQQAIPSPTDDGSPGDRMRQTLHELRTPVNAIQGFAEIIQQQLFGPVPNTYRALAAGVAVDAARLLAGFEELDRLAGLETGSFTLAGGAADAREALVATTRRLEGVLRPRGARIDLKVQGGPFTIPIDRDDAMQLLWRVLATLAGALAPGEATEAILESDGAHLTFGMELPATLDQDADIFAATARAPTGAVSAGMFGSGFSFRLARAEALAAGGSLMREDDRLLLTLPLLTGGGAGHSVDALDQRPGRG